MPFLTYLAPSPYFLLIQLAWNLLTQIKLGSKVGKRGMVGQWRVDTKAGFLFADLP
jgi:hypothetical protein